MSECKKSTGGKNELKKDLQYWQAPPDIVSNWLVDSEPDIFRVFPNCHQAVILFLQLQTQWRISLNGCLTGLDYSAVRCVMENQDLWSNKKLFQDIQNMEFSAIQCNANTVKK